MWTRFASNAFANVITGAMAMAFQLGVTAIATRTFDSETFSIWALAFSMGALAPLFSASLATVVTRQLVTAATHGRDGANNAVLKSARQVSTLLSFAALVFIVAGAWALQHLSPNLKTISAGHFALVALLVAMSPAVSCSRRSS